MNIIKKGNQNNIAVLRSEEPLITDVQSALDLAITLSYSAQTNHFIIPKCCITEEFFNLSTRLAGEILQKYRNYNIKVAIVGDFSAYTGKAFHDFVYESNRGCNFFFAATEDEAVQFLDHAQ